MGESQRANFFVKLMHPRTYSLAWEKFQTAFGKKKKKDPIDTEEEVEAEIEKAVEKHHDASLMKVNRLMRASTVRLDLKKSERKSHLLTHYDHTASYYAN